MKLLRSASLAFSALSVAAPLGLLLLAEIGTHEADIATGGKVCGMGIMAAFFVGAMVSVAGTIVAVALGFASRRWNGASAISLKAIAVMALGPAWCFLLSLAMGFVLRLMWGQS
ncbi:MAG TPA: hypothetical protein H9903_12725 [Candidatus Aquabacterium excrementipullorum]|nr:hypothetical protein [Candidatus Aquabacterium excrementipullorum]